MKYRGKLLALMPSLAGDVEQLVAEPRPTRGYRREKGSRIGYAEITGILEPSITIPFGERITALANDESVREIIIYANSPGGLCQGTEEASVVLSRAAKIKPVHVLSEGLLCSAAYYICCKATSITASPSTLVGSLGTMQVISDDSEFYRAMGVKVLVIASGKLKGCGIPGVPVEDEAVAMLRRRVDDFTNQFMLDVLKGRHFTPDKTIDLFTGEAWWARHAAKLGLIDQVALFEDALAGVVSRIPAEKFAGLTGQAALDRWEQLATQAAHVKFVEDVPHDTIVKLASEYPTLAAQAIEHRRAEDRIYQSRRSSRCGL